LFLGCPYFIGSFVVATFLDIFSIGLLANFDMHLLDILK
jgi:hypothetical protein